MCANLECATDVSSCPMNYISYMIKEVEFTVNVDEVNSIIENLKSTSQMDNNINLVSVRLNRSVLFYNPFTAGYAYLASQAKRTMTVSVKLEPVPFSLVNPSAFVYDQLDLESEKLTSLIFMKAVSDLEAHEFIRSPVFRLYMDGYDYNHFVVGPFELMINFNKIKDFPDSDITEEELQQIKDQTDLQMDVRDASNYYCLGSYNEMTRSWTCASRNILSISENRIEFSVVTTGVFAVLYFPKVQFDQPQFCGFACRNKRTLTTLLLVILPMVLIVFSFCWALAYKSYSKMEEKIRFVSSGEEEAIFKENENREDTDDEVIAVENAKNAYNNPLLFKDVPDSNDFQDLQNTKLKLRYKDEKLLVEKLKQLRKNLSLKLEIEAIQDSIAHMKKLQGADAFEISNDRF